MMAVAGELLTANGATAAGGSNLEFSVARHASGKSGLTCVLQIHTPGATSAAIRRSLFLTDVCNQRTGSLASVRILIYANATASEYFKLMSRWHSPTTTIARSASEFSSAGSGRGGIPRPLALEFIPT